MVDRDSYFSRLFSEDEQDSSEVAPSSLKSRIYSALIAKQQESGPLTSLGNTKEAGHGLCKWEELMHVLPLGAKGETAFHCNVCHARILSEHFDNPPIFWNHCPYVHFKKT